MPDISSEQELADCVKQYTKELLSWALHKTSNLQVAEDLVQDTFVVAVEKFHTFKRESQRKTRLFGILNNKIADHYKKIYLNPLRFWRRAFINEIKKNCY